MNSDQRNKTNNHLEANGWKKNQDGDYQKDGKKAIYSPTMQSIKVDGNSHNDFKGVRESKKV